MHDADWSLYPFLHNEYYVITVSIRVCALPVHGWPFDLSVIDIRLVLIRKWVAGAKIIFRFQTSVLIMTAI